MELLLKGQNPQAEYGSVINPEQLLSKKFSHSMNQFFTKLALKNRHFHIVRMA